MASGWAASWKRYLLELMLVKDWFLMYPFINGQHAAYSTNHLEVGEHISKNDTDHKAEHYTFPLLTEPPPALDNNAPMLRLNHLYDKIHNVTGALRNALRRTPPRAQNDTVCASYNRASHDFLVTEGLTVVTGHFYTRSRFVGFLRNVLTYATPHRGSCTQACTTTRCSPCPCLNASTMIECATLCHIAVIEHTPVSSAV